jgi:hypothetical protein
MGENQSPCHVFSYHLVVPKAENFIVTFCIRYCDSIVAGSTVDREQCQWVHDLVSECLKFSPLYLFLLEAYWLWLSG